MAPRTDEPVASEDAPKDAGAADAAPSSPDVPEPCNLPIKQKGFLGSQTLQFGLEKRTYDLYVGDKYDGHTRLPIVFVFHGGGMSSEKMRSWMSLEWEAGGRAIFVYPNGPGQSWDTFTSPDRNADYAYVDSLIDEVESKLCVDKKRRFAWGISRGAFFVNHLGCFRGDKFRGVIPNSGGGPSSQIPEDRVNNFFTCPSPPVAALVIHGDADDNIDFSAGDDSQRHWRVANACKDVTTPINPGPCVSYEGCERPVVWCHLGGWPHKLWTPSMSAAWTFIESMNP